MLHLPKAPFPIDITLSGIVTLVRPWHSQNALSPIEVTLLEIVMLVSGQSVKAFCSIEVTLLGIVILLRLEA